MLAIGAAAALSSGATLPAPPAWVLQAALAAVSGPLAALAAAKAALADDLHVELHEGQLHVQWVPVSGQACGAEAIQVPASRVRLRSVLAVNPVVVKLLMWLLLKAAWLLAADGYAGSSTATLQFAFQRACIHVPSTHALCAYIGALFPQVRACADACGRGAFARQRIRRGSCIGEYEGELLSEEQFWARYPSGMVIRARACFICPCASCSCTSGMQCTLATPQADFCMRIDNQWTLDAVALAQDGDTFSACFINHSRKRWNVRRRVHRRHQRIYLFAARDIAARAARLSCCSFQYNEAPCTISLCSAGERGAAFRLWQPVLVET